MSDLSVSIRANYIHTNYSNSGNGYSINVYSTYVENIPLELQKFYMVTGKRKIHFSAKGYSLPTSKSYEILLTGKMYISSQYGLQLDVESASIVIPSDTEGIKKYLCDFIDGCGPKTAEKIVKKFGKQTFQILDTEPERLYELRIRKDTAKKMIDSYKYKSKYADLAKFLTPFNCGIKTVMKVQNHFEKDLKKGEDVVEKIKKNPFILSDLRGFSFKILNEMGKKYNTSPTAPERIRAGIKEVLYNAEENGHLYLPQRKLKQFATQLLNKGLEGNPVTSRMVVDQIIQMAKNFELMGDNGNAYLQRNYCNETDTARIIRDLLLVKRKYNSLDKIMPKVEADLGFKLSKNQYEAVNMAINNQISLVIGGAGTGKSTVLKAIINCLYDLGFNYEDISLAAPTGKAAQRMYETTGHEASTIHSLLGLYSDEDVKPEERIELHCKFLIVDEFSMADMWIAYKIFTSIEPKNTQVLFVGDTGQLPSVGAGNVLHELINSKEIPVTELNVIFRQAAENKIVSNSKAIREGLHNIEFNDDFSILQVKSDDFKYNVEDGKPLDEHSRQMQAAEYAADYISEMYLSAVEKLGIDNVQVLSPLKNNGPCCTSFLNKRIQYSINPSSPTKKEHQVGGTLFREGDRVIQLKNVEVSVGEDKVILSNGDTGRLQQIYKDTNDNWCFKIDFGNNRVVIFDNEQMLNVKLGYALTIHKSQGSEYKKVFIPLLDYFPKNMLYRNLLYTGITRAKETIQIVGNPKLIHQCINTHIIINRNTALGWRIQNYIKAEKESA